MFLHDIVNWPDIFDRFFEFIRNLFKCFILLQYSGSPHCQYVLTGKSSGMLARQEFELPIDEAAYRTLCAKADGNVIAKTRYKIPLNQGLTLELGLFEGLFDGLVMGEVVIRNSF